MINPFENDEEFDSRPDIRQMTEAEAIRVIEETQHGRIIEKYDIEEGGDQRREKVLAAIQKRWEWLFAKGLHFRGPYRNNWWR